MGKTSARRTRSALKTAADALRYGVPVEPALRPAPIARRQEDTFADERLLLMPAATGALLVLFARNHNYIADRILRINERGTFETDLTSAWLETHPDGAEKQDDEVFNKARLVNCGYFMQVILGDYLGAILGTVREGIDWCLNPLEACRSCAHIVTRFLNVRRRSAT